MPKVCDRCDTLQNSRVVLGTGPSEGNMICFVGEAPGREEDEQGAPFVGGAGKILSGLLHNSGIKREEVYITNVVKCRPPNNRTPTTIEIKNCLPHLVEELVKRSPRIIVALGDTAAAALTGRNMVWRGSIVPCLQPGLENVPVLITYHPAYLMRNRTEYNTVLNDLDKIFNPPHKYPTHYIDNPSLEWVTEKLRDLAMQRIPTAIDIETAGEGKGLNAFTDQIIGIAFCWAAGQAFNLDFRYGASDPYWKPVKEFLESGCPVILQNNTFDLLFLKLNKGIEVKNLYWDTLDAMYTIYSDSDKDLDYLRSIYTAIDPYKHVYRTKGISNLTQTEMNLYNNKDVDVTLQVAIRQIESMNPTQINVTKTILKADKLATKMKIWGVGVDKEQLAKHYLRLKPEVEQLENEFFSKYNVNPGSPKQVGTYLFDVRNLPLVKGAKTQTGYSVNVEVIEQIIEKTYVEDDLHMLRHLLEFRKKSRELSTNVEGLFKLINPKTGRLHPDWRPTGTDTGRWACKAPNMQNVPKHMRDVFVPKEGYEYFIVDFSQLELLTIAILAKDDDLVNAILSGKDIHGETNEEMNKVTPVSRTITKAFVFGTAYGMSANTGARRFHLPLHLTQQLQSLCYNKFPKLLEYSAQNIRDWERLGYLETPFGRRKYCETPMEALNVRSQSTGFCIVQEAMFNLDSRGWTLSFQVHDELVCEEPIGTRDLEDYKEAVIHPVDWIPAFPVKVHKAKTWLESKDSIWEDDNNVFGY